PAHFCNRRCAHLGDEARPKRASARCRNNEDCWELEASMSRLRTHRDRLRAALLLAKEKRSAAIVLTSGAGAHPAPQARPAGTSSQAYFEKCWASIGDHRRQKSGDWPLQ